MRKLARRIVLGALAGSLLAASAALAGGGHGSGKHDDHEAARAAVERGEALPLGDILDRVQGQLPGRILEVEFEREDDIWVYEFSVLRPDGRRVEVYVDAATAAILSQDED